jgi:photosystem II stability/assembly factor-like uncharacterized protein
LKTFVGLALTGLVAAAAAFSFSPRDTPPLAATRLPAERMHMNTLTQSSLGLVAGGELGHILLSDDQGRTWKKAVLSHDRQAPITRIVFDTDGKFGVAVGHESWVLKTDDGGLNWTEVAFTENNGEPLMGVAQMASGDWIAVGAFGRALRFTPTLSEKTPLALPESVLDFHMNTLIPSIDDNSWLIVGERGLVVRSDDQGQNWRVIEPFYNGSFYGGAQLADRSWIVYGMRGNVYTSEDGQTWTRSKVPVPASFFDHLVLEDGRIVLFGQGGMTLYSSDLGRSFTFARLDMRASLIDAQALPDGKVLVAADAGIFSFEPAPAATVAAASGVAQ